MLKALTLDAPRECERVVSFIRQEFAKAGFSKGVVGVSGGVDSALVAALAAQALGASNVYAMILPYRTSNPKSEAHARLVIDLLGLPYEKFAIP
ncbi:MAG: NAD(+) synthetase, partial [Chloroflexi bacterium]|nr:NAD(+) synthetase [Chloroflexota bacterium]